jgi:hypothetical protein
MCWGRGINTNSLKGIAYTSFAKQIFAPPESPARSWSSFVRIHITSLYEAIENELKGYGTAISKKIDEGPQSHLFRKIVCSPTSTLNWKFKIDTNCTNIYILL